MYKKSSLVEQIWVYGNSFESILVAVVVPNEDTLKTWASQNGIEGDFAAICRDKRTHDYLSGELAQTAKAGKLKVPSQATVYHLWSQALSSKIRQLGLCDPT